MQKVLSARFLSLGDDPINEAYIGIFLCTEEGFVKHAHDTMACLFGYRGREAMLSEVTSLLQLLSEAGSELHLKEFKDRKEVLSKELR